MNISPELALLAYAQGFFPMAETKDTDHISWVKPKVRGVIPLDSFHVSRKLGQKYRNMKGQIFCDKNFAQIIKSCQFVCETREDTWINDEIVGLYMAFHKEGHAHSVEYWEGDELLGGLYGLHIGGVFFGESMFSRVTNASKFCLIKLVEILSKNKFSILDAQFSNEHLMQFGLIEVAEPDFNVRLEQAIAQKRLFNPDC